MKRVIIYLLCLILFVSLFSCTEIGQGQDTDNVTADSKAETDTKIGYLEISAEEAKKLMTENPDAVILDVREADEYNGGHIPGAVLLPYRDIPEKAQTVIPEKDRMILVYCRSGRRSKIASDSLVALGYSAVYEFGGIIDWPYETE